MNFMKNLFQQNKRQLLPHLSPLYFAMWSLKSLQKKKQYIQKYELTLKYNKFIWVYQNNVLQLLTEGTLSETSPVLTDQK